MIVFGHNGSTYYEKRLNTGDLFRHINMGSNTQGLYTNYSTGLRMITYDPVANTIAAGPLVLITGISYAIEPESSAYSIIATIDAGHFLSKTTGNTFTT